LIQVAVNAKMLANGSLIITHIEMLRIISCKNEMMRHKASSDSRKTKNSMLFQPIEVWLELNLHAGFNLI